jgi:hypothetical protein
MMLKLSKTSKMPCMSWSLPALTTCPGSRLKGGELVDACKGCYATTGFYNVPIVQQAREYNRSDWQRPDWVDEMIDEIREYPYFRWFDSGDVYHVDLADKILAVVKGTPHTKHWLPTRSYKIPKIRKILTKLKRYSNIVVRYSADKLDRYNKRLHGSVIVTSSSSLKAVYLCEAYTRGGKCGDCRACWDKAVKVVGYLAHGQKMKKVVDRYALV